MIKERENGSDGEPLSIEAFHRSDSINRLTDGSKELNLLRASGSQK